jgi:hypothetical protein
MSWKLPRRNKPKRIQKHTHAARGREKKSSETNRNRLEIYKLCEWNGSQGHSDGMVCSSTLDWSLHSAESSPVSLSPDQHEQVDETASSTFGLQ